MNRILSALTAAALVVGSAIPALADKLDDIRAAGVVRIGVSLGGEPIGFRDAQNNPVGYDVDVATRLGEALGVPVGTVRSRLSRARDRLRKLAGEELRQPGRRGGPDIADRTDATQEEHR